MASTITYLMFVFLVFSVVLGDIALNQSDSAFMAFLPTAPAPELSIGGNQLTGAAIGDGIGSRMRTDVMVAIMFLIVSVYLLYRMRDAKAILRFSKALHHYRAYAGFILRLLVGIVFVWGGFSISKEIGSGVAFAAFMGSLLYMAVGLMLMLGWYTRIAAYIGLFVLLKQMFNTDDALFTLLVFGNTLLLFILGAGIPSIDAERQAMLSRTTAS